MAEKHKVIIELENTNCYKCPFLNSSDTGENCRILRKGVKKSIVKLCDAMLGGVIDINPVQSGDRTPCRYCELGNICRSSDGCRKLGEFDNDAEVIARMAE